MKSRKTQLTERKHKTAHIFDFQISMTQLNFSSFQAKTLHSELLNKLNSRDISKSNEEWPIQKRGQHQAHDTERRQTKQINTEKMINTNPAKTQGQIQVFAKGNMCLMFCPFIIALFGFSNFYVLTSPFQIPACYTKPAMFCLMQSGNSIVGYRAQK